MVAALTQRPSTRIVEPIIDLIRIALSGHAIFSAAICPVVPML